MNDSNSPYYPKSFTIFLQGSYKNDTNVYADSDVDVIIRLDEVFYTGLDKLAVEDTKLYETARSDATYSLAKFKADVVAWLTRKYGSDVKPGTKAIFIKGSGSRRDADVLVCAKLRRYYRFKNWDDQRYVEGNMLLYARWDTHRQFSHPSQRQLYEETQRHSELV